MNDVPENNVADGRSESPSDARDGWRRLLPTRKRLIAYTTTFVAVIVLNVQFSFDFASAGLVGLSMLLVPACVVLAIGLAAFGAYRPAKTLAGVAIVAILGFIVAYNLNGMKWKATEKTGQGIVVGLNAYKSANGRYPADLTDLVPTYLPDIPATSMGLISHPYFYYNTDDTGGEFELVFPCPTWMRCVYSSKNGVWYTHD